jgi:hypothetical protein
MQTDFVGAAGQAYREQMHEVSQDIETDQKQSQSIVAAVGRAEQDVRGLQAYAQSIQAAAQANNLTISDWQIGFANMTVLNTVLTSPSPLLIRQAEILQGHLNTLHAEANKADQELATAINDSLRKPATIPLIRGNDIPGNAIISDINDVNQNNFNQETGSLTQELSKPRTGSAASHAPPTITQVNPDQVNQLVNQANQANAMQRRDQQLANEYS